MSEEVEEVVRKHPAAECENCPLQKDGLFVPSDGPAKARIAFVGEAAGRQEVDAGKPFIGVSGQLLDKVNNHYNITRRQVLLTNATLCRPPGLENMSPPAGAIKACRPRLIHELTERGVETAVALGNVASQSLLASADGVTKLRVGPGKPSPYAEHIRVVPTFHPAACLRNPDFFPSLVKDISKINRKQVPWEPPKYVVYDTVSEAIAVLKEVKNHTGRRLVIDIETDIEKDVAYDHPNNYELLCIGLGYDKKRVVVIERNALRDSRVLAALGDLLRSKDLTAQNGKYDIAGLYPHVGALELKFDTMLASYAKDERRGVHSLDYQGIELLGTPDWKHELDKYEPRKNGYGVIPVDELDRYNAYDVSITWDLQDYYEERLSPDERADHDHRVAASNQLVFLELNGIKIDVDYNTKLTTEYLDVLEGIKDKLVRLIDDPEWSDFNPNSPKQVKEVIEDIFSISIPLKRNQKGQPAKSTDEETLRGLSEKFDPESREFDFLSTMLEWRENAKLYGCVDEDTQILTQRGWLRFNEVREGDQTLSVNPETGLSEWDTVEGVHLYPGRHNLVSWEGKTFSALTTHDHRWLTNRQPIRSGGRHGWLWKTTDTVRSNDRIPKAVPCADLPTVPKYRDEFVELVAWLWTEGSVDGPGLNIIQSHAVNEPNVLRIRRALTTLYPNPDRNRLYWSERQATERITEFYIGARMANEFKEVFLKHKVVNPEFIRSLTKAQLQLFVDVSILGDGCTKGDALDSISQENTEQLFAVQLACTLLGISTSIGWYNNAYRMLIQRGIWHQPLQAARGKNGLEIKEVEYTGTVWCVSTRNANWLARRNGKLYYTGNTYVKGIRKRLYQGRVYPSFLLHGTTTGRLACRNPNLQNVPRGSKIRSQFIPASAGNVFVSVDYSQAELRVLTWLAQEEYFRSIFNDGDRDLFNELAPVLYGDISHLSPAEKKEKRIRVKAYVYGLGYGREALSIAQEFKIGVMEAQSGMDAFFDVIPHIVAYQKSVEDDIRSKRVLTTPFGRRRRFHLLTAHNINKCIKEGLAFRPQSISSDLCLRAFTWARPALRGKAQLRNIVHDNIMAECREKDAEEVGQVLNDLMLKSAQQLVGDYVQFATDTTVGDSWGAV